jgi:predicted HD superfamily hydrolase involved in NAD metabolism
MWNELMMEGYLKKNLNSHRYEHSLSVRDTAVELSTYLKEDTEKAKIAGLIHDCAKNMEDKEIINIIRKSGYNVDEVEENNPNIMHGLAGSIIAKDIMGVYDQDILNSIAFHTTGRKNMSSLEKIIYIADYIEPKRNFPGVESLRELTYINLDEALLMSFDNTLRYVIERKQLIHYKTIEARNYLMTKLL